LIQIKALEAVRGALADMRRKTFLFYLSLGWLAVLVGALGFVVGHWW